MGSRSRCSEAQYSSRAVEALMKIAAPVQQPDADYGPAPIRRLLQEVSGQHAEPTRVQR
jgi:hypothetical protein